MFDEWSNVTADAAHEKLKGRDVSVTNQSDKEKQLPKLLKLDSLVQRVLRDKVQSIDVEVEIAAEMERLSTKAAANTQAASCVRGGSPPDVSSHRKMRGLWSVPLTQISAVELHARVVSQRA